MATTTNFGWETPDDTDLVKDGAAAMRTLGSAIDTSLVDLKGGTTGQVLSKASATDMDFTWAGAGGVTLLSTTTLSGSSTTISSISGSYKTLYFVVRNFLPTAATLLRFRFNADATANRHHILSYTAGDNDNVAFNDTGVYLTSASNTSTSQSLVYGTIPDYANTTTRKTLSGVGYTTNETTSANYNVRFYNAAYNQTAAISSMQFYVSTGTITSGTVYLYGVN